MYFDLCDLEKSFHVGYRAQAVTTEANAEAESSNPPVASTTLITEVVRSSYPNQLAALASGQNTFPPEQQLNLPLSTFPCHLYQTALLRHWLRSITYLFDTCRLQFRVKLLPQQYRRVFPESIRSVPRRIGDELILKGFFLFN